MTAEELPFHPIIRGALSQNGYSPEDALGQTHWLEGRSPFLTSASRLDLPFLMFDRDGGSIDWGRTKISFRFRRRSGTYVFALQLPRIEIPASVFVQMPGRRLGDLVDIAGADSMIINAIDSDDDCYVLDLENVIPKSGR